MAPSTPPPPRSEVFAALTMASTSSFVMSPVWTWILSWALLISHPEHAEACLLDLGVERGGQAERQHLACPGRIDDAVIPEPCRGIERMAFMLVLHQVRLLEFRLLLGAPLPA